jgi:hypothetical protein
MFALADELVVAVYKITRSCPVEERFGLHALETSFADCRHSSSLSNEEPEA